MSVPVSGYSRFHAIVTAKPLHDTGPPVLPTPAHPQLLSRAGPYKTWDIRFHDGKRRRDTNSEARSDHVKKGTRTEDDGTSSREPLTMYVDCDRLLLALRDRFQEGPEVDFNGTYEMLNTDSMTHKQRIQMVANEIWKITGYRFTVKDHPQFTNGYKTRFWCSQDDAHRSKSSRVARKAQGTSYKPRVTSTGEVMAKARYACHSRLLISSRDTNLPRTRTCVVTVRLHHQVAHEPYVDTTQPPEVVQRILESWLSQDLMARNSETQKDANGVDHVHAASITDEESSEEDTGSPEDSYEAMEDDRPENLDLPPFEEITDTSQIPEFHARMKAHISNLREFCEGLEYQLQFNDYRMLDMLEREGGSFLGLVAECLRKEGRLNPTHDPTAYPLQSAHIIPHPTLPPQLGIDPPRTYQSNPGINPSALNY